MKNMNKKAKAFQDLLDKEESKAFTVEAVADDAAHAVAFRSRLVVQGQQFYAGDGIITKGIEGTIDNVGRLGKDGMKETNEEIIRIMIND